MKSIIQFLHPGKEHSINSGEIWNVSSHKRKYLKLKGSYVFDLSLMPIDDTVCFWGEWEAQSKGQAIPDNMAPLPINIFEPYYSLPVPINGCNTDPFFIGDQFYYCICKQGHYPSLRSLDSGALILFGSHRAGNFLIDSVFVVKDSIEYEVQNIESIKLNYNEVFYNVSLSPLNISSTAEPKEFFDNKHKSCGSILISSDAVVDNTQTCLKQNNSKCRIYQAVMYNDRKNFDGMFSFAPCLPYNLGKNGFARPIINSCNISQTLKQGIKILSNQLAKDVWSNIVQQIFSNKLNLMIKTDLPSNCTYTKIV